MNQQTFDNAEVNREKLMAVQNLLLDGTIVASVDQNFSIEVQGASDFLKTIATSQDFSKLANANYTDLITPLNAKLKTLVTDIKAILEGNVTSLNNEFAQL